MGDGSTGTAGSAGASGSPNPGAAELRVAWAVEHQGGVQGVDWEVDGADQYHLEWHPADAEPVTIEEAGKPSELKLPVTTQAGPGHYRVVALKGTSYLGESAIGDGKQSGKAALSKHISNWKQWEEIAPRDENLDIAIGSPSRMTVNGHERTQQKRRVTRTPEEIVTFNPNLNMMWPGCIVQAKHAIRHGHLVPAQTDTQDRAPLTIVVDNLTAGASTSVPKPAAGAVVDAIKEMVKDKEAGPRDIAFSKTQANTSTEVCLELGLSAKYGGFSGQFNLSASLSERRNTVVAYLRERAFTAYCEMDNPDSFFNDKFTEKKLATLVTERYMGPDNPPLIVSSTVYGRILMFSFTAAASETDIKATLQAGYSGGFDVSTTAGAKYKQIASSAEIHVLSRGGNSQNVYELINSGRLDKYFAGNAPKLEEYGLIGYTLHTLDGAPAKMSETTEYDDVTWSGFQGAWTYGIGAGLKRWGSLVWFFKEGRCVRYNPENDVVSYHGPITGKWPALEGTVYAAGFDACLQRWNQNAWFFKDDRCLQYDPDKDKVLRQGRIADLWPGLRGTAYASGFEACVVRANDNVWFFKGSHCLQYNPDKDTVRAQGRITDHWPGLAGTVFASGIDAAQGRSDPDVWFFKADQALVYQAKTDKVMWQGRIADYWPGLATVAET
ncbi:thiol-activated cytolysin family protein [Streptomyces roseoverticillatus]|uniref:thiol-activated cytolysin family protein n=1 Tax=Streptomyces roseoverticillatus TaxID=66429 RepID=UPI0004C119FE|nr:thiol-activated cytolysin family protein [Streptomyces roseoverticillatus]